MDSMDSAEALCPGNSILVGVHGLLQSSGSPNALNGMCTVRKKKDSIACCLWQGVKLKIHSCGQQSLGGVKGVKPNAGSTLTRANPRRCTQSVRRCQPILSERGLIDWT